MGKDYLVEGAKLKCISGSGTVELKIPKGCAYISDEKRKAIKTDCVPGKNIPSFGKCAMNKKDHVCRGCVSLTKEWITLPGNTSFGEEKVNDANAITMQSFLVCVKGGIVYPISSGQKPGIGERKSAGNLPFWKIIGRWLGANTLIQILAGEPINVNIGNFICEKEDLVIKGITEMKFRMFYNSMDQTKGGSLGEGWRHNYEMHIRRENENVVQVCLGDGREIPYRLATGNIYIPVFGDTGKLVKGKEIFTYRTSEGMKYIFDETGRLSVKEDKNGNGEIFSYNENGQLILVKSSNGGSYTYIYNAEGYLISVCDHAGRKIHFLYRYGKLYQFVNSCGFAYTYSYNENGKLESIKTPMGIQSVKNTYDSASRVIKQELPDGGMIELVYNNGCTYMREQNRNMMLYQSDECFRNVRTVYEDGEESFAYNDKNQRVLYVDKNGNRTTYSYDENGNLTEIKDALGRQRRFTYDGDGRLLTESMEGRRLRTNTYNEKGLLIKTEDALGRSRKILYNEKGWPEKIIHPDSSFLTLEYDEKGNIVSARNYYGTTVRYEYDNLNRVKTVINEEGKRIQYEYNDKNHLLKILRPDGSLKRYAYNEKGKIIQVQDYDGGILNIEYNIMDMPEKIKDKKGKETRKKYDNMGNLIQIIFPTGAVLSYKYDKYNRIIRMELSKDEKIERPETVCLYTYDPMGNLLHVSAGDGKEILSEIFYEYDVLNRVVAVKYPTGGKVCYEYDRVTGKVCKISDSAGNIRRFCYNDAGELIKEIDVRGNITTYEYSPLGKLCTVTDGGGRIMKHLFLPGGRLEKSIYPTGREIKYVYDCLGRVSKKLCKGQSMSYSYDLMGRMIQITGNAGQKKCYTYDTLGHVTSVTDALGNISRFVYDMNGNLVEVVDALGNKTEYAYNEINKLVYVCQYGKMGEEHRTEEYKRNVFGQVEYVRDALGMEETYQYDALGRIINITDKDGIQTGYTYRFDGRVESILYGDGNISEFSYTPMGQLLKMKDWMGETQIKRNQQGQPESITDHNGQTIHYEWGRFGERTGVIYPDGTVLHYHYDNMLRLTELEKVESECEGMRITYGYDEEGRLSCKKNSGGYVSKWSYNDLGQLHEMIHEDERGVIDRYQYDYDALGNKSAILKERRGLSEESGMYTYFYDELGRLTETKKDELLLRTYQYDSFGNRIGMKDQEHNVQRIYTFDALNQLREEKVIFEEGKKIIKSYNYDRRGNMIEEYQEDELCHGYQFGALNRLERAWDSSGREAIYFYNGLGQRTGRKSGNSEERYLLDLTKNSQNLLEIETAEKKQKFYWDNNLAVMEEDNLLHYNLQDELGSPLRVLYDTGKGEVYGFNEFGMDLCQSSQWNVLNKHYGEHEKSPLFGYTGYRYDDISGTYFAQAREYRPDLGRFAAVDVERGDILYPYTLNRNIYCWNRPMDFVDADGRKPKDSIKDFFVQQGNSEMSLSEFSEWANINSPVEEPVEKPKVPEPETSQENVITVTIEAGVGVGTSAEALGGDVEAELKMLYLALSNGDVNFSYGSNLSAGIAVEQAEAGAGWQYQYDILNDTLIEDGISMEASLAGFSEEDGDIIFSWSIGGYAGIGGEIEIDFNLSQAIRNRIECS